MKKNEEAKDRDSAQIRPEELIYHYTDENGLTGILSSGFLRATHWRYLNDYSERQEFIRLLLQRYKGRHEHFDSIPQRSGKPHPAIAIDKNTQRDIVEKLHSIEAYSVSFSKEEINLKQELQMIGDRLSQWRGYGQAKQGFSLGFDREKICTAAEYLATKVSSINLWQCEYVDDLKQAKITEILAAPDLFPIDQLHQYASTFKHFGFHEEQERRLILRTCAKCPPANLIEFDAKGRPYINVPAGIKGKGSSLRRIVVGPGEHNDEWVAKTKILLAKEKIEDVDVVPSKIPYRNW
ncbi:MAG: DUF2971 domain-containing protein [Terracidiphilus sp.]|nr:DUF2971 domain-containing protein [Terracidiphilus sp.]